MALLPIPKLPFPNVPNMPGVPAIARSKTASAVVTAVLGKVQGEIWRALTTEKRWGIFGSDGKPLVIADTVLDLGYKNSSKVSTYPVQAGPFASYNKVINPFEATVRMARGGSLNALGEVANLLKGGSLGGGGERERTEFLDAIDDMANSLDLVNVVTPEKTYTNCNITGYSYRREQTNGAYLLIVEITLIEIREVEAQYTQTESSLPAPAINAPQSVNAASPVNVGKVQAQPVQNRDLVTKISDAIDQYGVGGALKNAALKLIGQ
ncbi:MAG: hypothetical protein EOO69_04475 [Moraxellaceae bacterium]|nr:MAG: hypothetical protein EOO69_04475 [Moraxellaceae bacterium]